MTSPLLLIAILGSTGQQSQQPRQPDTLQAVLQSRLDAYRVTTGIPGAVLGVATRDGRVIAIATGMSDTAKRQALTPDSRLLMGSVGKTYVAATAIQLVREGKLELDAKASRYVGGTGWYDSLPNAADITVRHLLNHTSGLVR